MAENELTIFLILVNVTLLIFIGGIAAFVMLYRQRKIRHDKEKQLLHQLHRQALMEAQLEAQQQTMRDIGREIHDNVGQKLTLASLYAQSILHARQSDHPEQQVTEIAKIINDSLQDLRQLSKSLVQPELAQKSLFELLTQEALLVNQSGMCLFKLNMHPSDLFFSVSAKNNLFRLAQEFIQNSLKHSKCRQIFITIEQKEEVVYFHFADDGIGFDVNDKKTGIGLSNIRRRANELNVTDYEFISTPHQGTELRFALKL